MSGSIPKIEFIPITELEVFQGWDSPENMSDISVLMEYQHAWKDFHNRYSCGVQVNPKTFQPARKFCQRIGLPFRWYVNWSCAILETFPHAWELNMSWLMDEVESLWLEIQNVKVIKGVDPAWQATSILKALKS